MARPVTFAALLSSVAWTIACCAQDRSREEFAPDDPVLLDALADGELTEFECQALCGIDVPDTADTGFSHDADALSCEAVRENDERVVVKCIPHQYCKGRFSDGLADETVRAHSPLGAWFAHAAWSERASIASFRRLRRELHAHGAPSALVRAAGRGVRDEIRHGHAMARLANRFGTRVPPVRVEHGPVRPLVDVLRENAVEGCVRETFAAIVAHHQAAHAATPGLRAVFASIARDEARHARLAWRVHRWGQRALDPAAAADVRDAARTASIGVPGVGDPHVRRIVGEPSPEAQASLAALARSRLVPGG